MRLDEAGHRVSRVFADAAARGVVVKGLLWRSHLDQFALSEQENRHLGEEIEAAGGECVRDMRVRPGGSHHQKFVVLRHPGRPELDVAFAGGIDLCHSRLDGPDHGGDHQRQPMAKIYGPRPPWHDVQLRIQGPAVADIETVFRERWEDPARLTRNPINLISDVLRRHRPVACPAATSRPGRSQVNTCRSCEPIPTAARLSVRPHGERSVAHAYEKVVDRAHSLIYLEDQ
jgi:phosphatidylserine/phosphatidylglycerophosphate/cardiolipin synthase-like enzyme